MYPAKTDTVRIAVSAPIQYRILTPQYMDSKQPDSSAAENRYPSSNSLLGSVAFLSSVDKKYTSNGTEIYELYKDTDGNGILYTAATGLVPQMKLYATYMNGTSVTELLVCFDAGADRNCDSIKDNRIISLNRRESDNGIERELIEYGKEFLTSGEDTAVLSVKKFSPVNSAESTVTSYICLHGTDTLDHRLNALHSFAQNLTYRSGTVHSISSSVILPSPLAGLSAPATASIHAVVRFTDGHEAVLDGTVDFTVKTLTGTYTENGKTAAVKYEKTGDKLDVQE